MRRPAPASALASVCLTVFLAACTSGGDAPEPTNSVNVPSGSAVATASGEPTSTPAPSGVVTTADYLGAHVDIAVHPLEVAGGKALLTADLTLQGDAPAGSIMSLGVILRSPGSYLNVGRIRLLDLPGSTVLEVGRGSGRTASTSGKPLNLEPGKPVTVQAIFAAPSSSSVDVLLPYFGLVERVPVETATTLDTTPDALGAPGDLTYLKAPIDAFDVAYDSSSAARVEGDAATVALSSDVLFASDEATLTSAAKKVVDQAADEILATGRAGVVTVVGHTDDVDTDAYNLALSTKRANAVADELRPSLGSGYTVRTVGKGESDPAVRGTSAAARKANRRVEIRYTTTAAGTRVTAPASEPAPKASGPVGSGSTSVPVTVDDVDYTVAAAGVQRRDGFLVGSLAVTRTSDGRGSLQGFFGDYAEGLALGRGLSATTLAVGAFGATLLGESSRSYPADYVAAKGSSGEPDRRGVLTDEFLDQPMGQGQTATVTVVWPDPGGDTVSIDVPQRFRLTDVPVTP